MSKQIRLNALDMDCMGACPGLWLHPRDETGGYTTLPYWIKVAQILERGLFDSLFIADIYGVYDVWEGSADAAIRNAVEFPVCDPMMLVSALATVTKDLSFGITGTLSYEPPFSFARRVSTLDHLTGGRFAWNIVTGYLNSAAKAFGKPAQMSHDDRYAMAEEYMEVVYKLWESSWEDDAAKRDKVKRIFADPSKVHKIKHAGKHFNVEAFHLCEPSPQRTPVLFQAGASTAGRTFAAKHAECVFITGLTSKMAGTIVADIRKKAESHGRAPASVIIYTAMTVIVAATDEEAQAKLAEYKSYVSVEGTLALYGGYSGIDFSNFDLDTPIGYVESNAIQTFVEGFSIMDPDRTWTLRQIAEFLGIGGFAPIIVGSPQTVATELERWMTEADIDGFNIVYAVSPGDLEDFVDLVVPELQQRGLYRTEYAPGTLREKIYGQGQAHLREDHPGYRFKPHGQSASHSSSVTDHEASPTESEIASLPSCGAM